MKKTQQELIRKAKRDKSVMNEYSKLILKSDFQSKIIIKIGENIV